MTIEQLNCGSLMRIADALEKMAQPYLSLIEDVNRYKRWNEENREQRDRADRSNAALRGQITKLRKRIARNGDNP